MSIVAATATTTMFVAVTFTVIIAIVVVTAFAVFMFVVMMFMIVMFVFCSRIAVLFGYSIFNNLPTSREIRQHTTKKSRHKRRYRSQNRKRESKQ